MAAGYAPGTASEGFLFRLPCIPWWGCISPLPGAPAPLGAPAPRAPRGNSGVPWCFSLEAAPGTPGALTGEYVWELEGEMRFALCSCCALRASMRASMAEGQRELMERRWEASEPTGEPTVHRKAAPGAGKQKVRVSLRQNQQSYLQQNRPAASAPGIPKDRVHKGLNPATGTVQGNRLACWGLEGLSRTSLLRLSRELRAVEDAETDERGQTDR